jgi:ribonuclease HI
MPVEAAASLELLATQLDLAGFDLLLAADGSGTDYGHPAGWACVAYDRATGRVNLHLGGLSCGTNNFAELAPFLQALWHDHQENGQAVQGPRRVMAVTDSELTVRCGNRQYSRSANGCLWAGVGWFEERGYELTWTHVRRNSDPWAAWLDEMARFARSLLEEALKVLSPSPAGPVVSTQPSETAPAS